MMVLSWNVFQVLQHAVRFTVSVIRETSESTIKNWLEISVSPEAWVVLMGLFISMSCSESLITISVVAHGLGNVIVVHHCKQI